MSERRHHIVESSPLIWRSACGAYGETAPKLLTRLCRGDPKGRPELRGMAAQLRQLIKGKHPRTGAELGPPVAASHLASCNECGSEELQRGAEPAQDEAGRPTILQRVRLKEARRLVQTASNKRKIEEFLNANEIEDPELVAFWAEPLEQHQQPEQRAGVSSWDAIDGRRHSGGNSSTVDEGTCEADKRSKRLKIQSCERATVSVHATTRQSRMERLSSNGLRLDERPASKGRPAEQGTHCELGHSGVSGTAAKQTGPATRSLKQLVALTCGR